MLDASTRRETIAQIRRVIGQNRPTFIQAGHWLDQEYGRKSLKQRTAAARASAERSLPPGRRPPAEEERKKKEKKTKKATKKAKQKGRSDARMFSLRFPGHWAIVDLIDGLDAEEQPIRVERAARFLLCVLTLIDPDLHRAKHRLGLTMFEEWEWKADEPVDAVDDEQDDPDFDCIDFLEFYRYGHAEVVWDLLEQALQRVGITFPDAVGLARSQFKPLAGPNTARDEGTDIAADDGGNWDLDKTDGEIILFLEEVRYSQRSSEIASHIDFSRQQTGVRIGRLEERGYVVWNRARTTSGGVTLTDLGRRAAKDLG